MKKLNLQNLKLESGHNVPLTHDQVKKLPWGYTCTANYSTNRERHAAKKSRSRVGNNRKLTSGRRHYRAENYSAVLNHK